MGYISREDVRELAEALSKTAYGEYLLRLLEHPEPQATGV